LQRVPFRHTKHIAGWEGWRDRLSLPYKFLVEGVEGSERRKMLIYDVENVDPVTGIRTVMRIVSTAGKGGFGDRRLCIISNGESMKNFNSAECYYYLRVLEFPRNFSCVTRHAP
jgi:hypothetical protein